MADAKAIADAIAGYFSSGKSPETPCPHCGKTASEPAAEPSAEPSPSGADKLMGSFKKATGP